MATDKTIQQGNMMIAAFMGLKSSPSNGFSYSDGTNSYLTDLGLQYHSSWDWLMPVIDRIETLGSTIIFNTPTYSSVKFSRSSVVIHFSKDGQYLFNLDYKPHLRATYKHIMYAHHSLQAYDFKNNSLIIAVFDAIVDFLTWYNTQNK